MGTTKEKEDDVNSVQQNESIGSITKNDFKNTNNLSKVEIKVKITKLQDINPIQK